MPQVTLTGPTGPAKTMTGVVLADAQVVTLDLIRKVIQVVVPGRTVEMDLAATTTLTDTITAGNHVIVVTQ